MINEEKYKTVFERGRAFANFCHSHRSCLDCASLECDGYCKFKWLELEYEEEEEELLPCPFCGGEARVDDDLCHSDMSKTFYSVICKKCGARTKNDFLVEKEAIEQWNRRKTNDTKR